MSSSLMAPSCTAAAAAAAAAADSDTTLRQMTADVCSMTNDMLLPMVCNKAFSTCCKRQQRCCCCVQVAAIDTVELLLLQLGCCCQRVLLAESPEHADVHVLAPTTPGSAIQLHHRHPGTRGN
jgi:hypothetical protein